MNLSLGMILFSMIWVPAAEPGERVAASAGPHDSTFPRYVGVSGCQECHGGDPKESVGPFPGKLCPSEGLIEHALAFQRLTTNTALSIAKLSGEIALPTQSRICLSCHSTAADEGARWTTETFRFENGVQCEACHGPGEMHVANARAGRFSGAPPGPLQIRRGDANECKICHWEKPSHVEVVRRGFRLEPADSLYKTPVGLAVSPDGGHLFVVCQNANSIVKMDLKTRRLVAEAPVGRRPHAVALSPDGATAYVANRMSGTMTILETRNLALIREIVVGREPHGVAVDAVTGRVLVANTGEDTLADVDPDLFRVKRRFLMGSSPWSVAVDSTARRAYVTNVRPRLGAFRESHVSELTIVDLDSETVVDRISVRDANMLQGIGVAKNGTPALFTLMRTKNLIPTTRTAQGWVTTHGLGVLGPDGRVDQVLLDARADAFADIFDVAMSPDGATAVAVSGGCNEAALIDVGELLAFLQETPEPERSVDLPNRLGVSRRFIRGRIPVGRNPRAVAFSPDGRFAYTTNALDDSVSVLDVAAASVIATIPLGGPSEITTLRKGEQLFHDAGITVGRQFSCQSCHPDGHLNGLTFDIEADGVGLHPADNRTLQGIFDTVPFKWEGTNPSLQHQCGPRFAVFFTRQLPYTPGDLNALVLYMTTIERPPNRFREPDGLTLAQRHGKEVFERTHRNNGEPIPEVHRCTHCHNGAYRTNRETSMVSTTMWFDSFVDVDLSEHLLNSEDFGELGSYYFIDAGVKPKVLDAPHLTNIADGPPFLHNGAANTLEEVWTRFNMTDRHGATADLTRQQLNDLIAYLKAQ